MHESSFFEKWGALVAGRWSKWITVAVWIVLAAVLSIAAPSVNREENNQAASLPASAPSVVASTKLQTAFPSSAGQPALVVWYRAGGLTTADLTDIQVFTRQLRTHPIAGQKSIPPLDSMPAAALRGFESSDHTTFVLPVTFQQNVDPSVLTKSIQNMTTQIQAAAGKDALSQSISSPGLHVRITGPVGIAVDAQGLFKNADVTLLASTTLLVLVLLILLYRSPILAFVPLVGVGFAYGVVSPLLGLLAKSGIIVVDAQGISIMTVLLFGAGTDYCLFIVSRYRELLAVESDKHQAMKKAAGGAAGAVAMSGLTVVLSLFTLLFAKYGSDHRFAVPFSLSILVMALAGITLVPALLAILGRMAFFPFIPRTEEMRRISGAKRGVKSMSRRQATRGSGTPGRFSQAIGRIVSTRPWPVVIASVIVLGILASFTAQIRPTYDLLTSFPKTMQSREGYTLLSDHFSKGTLAPVQVMIQTTGSDQSNGASAAGNQKTDSGASQSAQAVAKTLKSLSFVQSVSQPKRSLAEPGIYLYNVTLNEDPYSLQAMQDIPIMEKSVQKTLGNASVTSGTNAARNQTGSNGSAVSNTSSSNVWIGGETATQYDTQQYTNRDTRTVIPIVIAIIAVLLLLYLRSVVAMVYLILTVVLSYFSALGLGWILLHYGLHTSAISGAIPLYSFVFLVALGEDYNIFMVSRIWQAKEVMTLQNAISEGVSRTSSVITSAGLILAATFAVLASLPLQILVQFGIVTAIGVLLDTFIVRPLLVPSITALLGRAAFWPVKLKQTDPK
ncbi:MMPL family transporter [Alicyclobacillus ferrooxydans]|uniref:SSD domain-containing protein n=1 Tax=Alicyclobacillus ferrooxydans TaxID=471514 RepID=A0A0N8PN79_9BACL|nr:MMPL family transporter [Alicyclobacillus ferrooxydans]KPV40773.1 hypothetical protein AN477_20860 [Alicyclobacillus ferrooxydans]